MNIRFEAQCYRDSLENFVQSNRLPRHWFSNQDHLALKAYNPQDYDNLIEEFIPMSGQITETRLDNRRIAAVRLLSRYSINMVMAFSPPQSAISWIELMEAKPEDQCDEHVRLDHEEIYFANGIIPIRAVLRRNQIAYFDQENSSHAWLSVIIDEDGNELKFSDKPLEEIILEDLETGKAKIIHERVGNS